MLGGLLVQPGVHGNLVADAHLAALAMEHGLTLCSTDGDFARFPKLRWQDPLAETLARASTFGSQPATVTLILAPAFTVASVFTSPSALAQMLHGLASRVSSAFEIGVRPKPMAMAWPSGQ